MIAAIAAGERFGRWAVLQVLGRRGGRVRVRCDCGTERTVERWALAAGRSRSCGCRRRLYLDQTVHGLRRRGGPRHPLYARWVSIRQRCNNARHPRYADYGGRGITVDPRWDEFALFVADLGDPPPGRSLDRIDVDGPYAPGNVRWSTAATQRRNQRHRAAWLRDLDDDEARYHAELEARGELEPVAA